MQHKMAITYQSINPWTLEKDFNADQWIISIRLVYLKPYNYVQIICIG